MEFEEDKKTIKSINLDDFSIEDLEEYIETLKMAPFMLFSCNKLYLFWFECGFC